MFPVYPGGIQGNRLTYIFKDEYICKTARADHHAASKDENQPLQLIELTAEAFQTIFLNTW